MGEAETKHSDVKAVNLENCVSTVKEILSKRKSCNLLLYVSGPDGNQTTEPKKYITRVMSMVTELQMCVGSYMGLGQLISDIQFIGDIPQPTGHAHLVIVSAEKVQSLIQYQQTKFPDLNVEWIVK